MKAMILAAGRGERMGELSRGQPKPLLEVAGERLIERQLRMLSVAGVTEVVINLSYHGGAIRETIGATTQWGQRVAYSDEGEPPLETGGGIRAALPLLGSAPFIVVNADLYTDFEFVSLTRAGKDNLLVLVPNPPHHVRGDFGLSESGRVTLQPPLKTFSGISVLSPTIFASVPAGRRTLLPILQAAIERGEVAGMCYDGPWVDVGTPERLAEARRLAAVTERTPREGTPPEHREC